MPDLRQLLGIRLETIVAPYVQRSLTLPATELLGRSGKNFRGRLVRIAFSLGSDRRAELVELCESVMEEVHAGSLIVDDIEDDSELRRGKPCLHRTHGLPIALNTGNWLYFRPLNRLGTFGLAPEKELAMYRSYHRALCLAHVGQSIDVGVRIDQVPLNEVYDLSLASLELKSGALTSLGLELGGIATGCSATDLLSLATFGVSFGMALQMFDDLGNFLGLKEPSKRFEDLKHGRPSWLWAVIARDFSDRMPGFKEVASPLPSTEALEHWASLNADLLASARKKAESFLSDSLQRLNESTICNKVKAQLRDLSTELMGAYR